MQKFPWLAALTLILVGCDVSMSHQEKVENLLPLPSIENSVSTALDTSAFEKKSWPSESWWENYHSNELNQLIELTLSQNPTIQSVQSRLEYAKENAIVVRGQLYPLITFDATDQLRYLSKNGFYRSLNETIPLANQTIDVGLSFFYEFDFWYKYRNQYRAALGYAKAAQAENAQAELIATTSIAQAFFALKTNLMRKELYEALYETRKSYFELQAYMQKKALYSELVPLLSQEDVFQAKQWVLGIEEEIATNIHLVNVLAGRGPDEPIDLGKDLPLLPKALALPDHIELELLSRRPDLMAQIWKAEALSFEVGAARADFWPNINITAFTGYESGSWSSLFNWASKNLNATPALALPVYTAGAIAANAHAKKGLFDEAVFQYNELLLKSFQEVTDLLAMGRAVYGKKEEQDKTVRNSEERYYLIRLLQEKGIDNALDVYRALEELLKKQLDDVQLLYTQYLVSVQLIRALGGGYDAERCDES